MVTAGLALLQHIYNCGMVLEYGVHLGRPVEVSANVLSCILLLTCSVIFCENWQNNMLLDSA